MRRFLGRVKKAVPRLKTVDPAVRPVRRLSYYRVARAGSLPVASAPVDALSARLDAAAILGGGRTLGTTLDLSPTGVAEVDAVKRELADAMRQIGQIRRSLAAVQAKSEVGGEYARVKSKGEWGLEDFANVDLTDIPAAARGDLERFQAEMDKAEAEGEYRTTRPLGKNVGRMI